MAKTETKPALETEPTPSLGDRLLELLERLEFVSYTTLVLALLAVSYFWPQIFIKVSAGERGVMFRYFKGGTIKDRVWGEGLAIIPPWDTLTLYDIRLQQTTLKLNVLSEEGLSLGTTVAVTYRLNQSMLGYLQQDIGPDYFEKMVRPQVEAHVRRIFGERSAHEIYGSATETLQELVRVPRLMAMIPQGPSQHTPSPYLDTVELKLMAVELPKLVENAIADKYRQEQLMLEYRYKLDREVKEAERKRTEAAGIRDYVRITGLSPQDLLRWKSIDAALDLAKSPNSKILMLGGGSSGLPVMLNLGDDATHSPNQAPAIIPGAATSSTPAATSPSPAAADKKADKKADKPAK